ncbi:MAG: hypothetical protein WCF26_18690 [Candidatus Sulfotelmatobacter sp.]
MDEATVNKSRRLNPLPFFPAVLPFILIPLQFWLVSLIRMPDEPEKIANLILENRMRMREKKIAVNSGCSSGDFFGEESCGGKARFRVTGVFVSEL